MGAGLYLGVCAVSGLTSMVLAVIAWRRRAAASASAALAAFFLADALWDLAYVLDETTGSTRIGLTVMYAGVALAAPAAFVFLARLGHFEFLQSRMVLGILAAISSVIVAAAALDSRLGLLFNGFLGSDRLVRAHVGPVFWLNVIYDYILLAGITAMVISYLRRNRHRLYRRQSVALLIGVIVPWASSLGLVLNLTSRDITPLALSITALAFAMAMWRYRGVSVVPIARSLLVDRMADAVIVLDPQRMISDMNPAAATMFRADLADIGAGLKDVPVLASALAELDLAAENPAFECVIPEQSRSRHVEITSHVLRDAHGRFNGTLIVGHDITHRMDLERALETLALTDALTGIGNRRRFEERLALEHARAARTGEPLTLVIVDLDHLKETNDAGGHRAGDAALRRVARHIAANVRSTDLAARIGGDEFAVLLPETDLQYARVVVDRILDAVRSDRDGSLIGPITVSIGVACVDARIQPSQDLESLADHALYAAKQAGRSQAHFSAAAEVLADHDNTATYLRDVQ